MNNLAPDLVIKERKCQLGALCTASSNILCQTLVRPCSGWNGWPISLLFVRFLPLTINSASLLGCIYTWFPGTDAWVQYLWALMWTHLFWRTRTRRSRPCTRALKWAPGPCGHVFSIGSEDFYSQSTSSLLLQKWHLLMEQIGRKTTWVLRVWTKHH